MRSTSICFVVDLPLSVESNKALGSERLFFVMGRFSNLRRRNANSCPMILTVLGAHNFYVIMPQYLRLTMPGSRSCTTWSPYLVITEEMEANKLLQFSPSSNFNEVAGGTGFLTTGASICLSLPLKGGMQEPAVYERLWTEVLALAERWREQAYNCHFRGLNILP